MLSLTDVTHVYPNNTLALDRVTLDIPRGMYGLLGPNGAGKSTTMKMITGFSRPTSGQVSVHVVRVMPGGNLEILGQKKLTLNNGDEYVRLHGIVRPNDILANNIVMSDRVANAEITYIGAGDLADAGRRGWLSRFISSLSPN